MSLNVSYSQFNNGIDTAALKEVTKQIFQRANVKNTNSILENADLSKFNRATLGTDLYSAKVNASTASQIAMAKSGMQVNLSENALQSLRYLNNEASKSIFKAVDGKINANLTENTAKQDNVIRPSFGRLTETADLDSDKRGSNPFYKGELLNIKKEDEADEALNVFA